MRPACPAASPATRGRGACRPARAAAEAALRVFAMRDQAPDDQHHHHHGGDLHDLQRPLAGFVHALDVLPPEIDGHHDGKDRGRTRSSGPCERRMAEVVESVGQEAREVLSGGDRADRAGQDVVEQQRRDRELGQRAAHRLLDHAVHAAAHEHGAGLDVEGAHRVAEEHDRQHEPGRALADDLFGVAAHVVGRRRQIAQHDGRSPPEGDEGQHHRGGDEDLDDWPLQIWRLGRHKGRCVPESTASLRTRANRDQGKKLDNLQV